MSAAFEILVFGKTGCEKCKVLNSRLDSLLNDPEWTDFSKRYVDVLTVDGLVEFCRAECLNPQRIPALLVTRRAADGAGARLPNPRPGASDAVCGDSRLYQWLGLQTDYGAGRGILSTAMIAAVLRDARASA